MNLWITGYRAYEIGVFGEKDPKETVIKRAIKNALTPLIEDGVEWVLTGGQPGVEQWTVDVVADLKADYPDVKVAVMTPFLDFGSNWKEDRQVKLAQVKQKADFAAAVSKQPYQSARQLKDYGAFMVDHTEAALFIYDEEYEGRAKFDFMAAKRAAEKAGRNYQVHQVTMLDLEDVGRMLQEEAEWQHGDF